MAIIAGVALALMGRPLVGAGIALVGLADIGTTWWFRSLSRPDPVLDAAIDDAMKVRKTDPAAADEMLDRAFMEAAGREEQELAQLQAKATVDKRGSAASRPSAQQDQAS